MILMARTVANRQAESALKRRFTALSSEFYPKVNLREISGDTLYIIDLEADGKFQKLYEPKRFAKFLIENELPESITSICLVVSDVLEDNPLLSFGTELLKSLLDAGKDLTVKVSTDINYGAVFIEPPNSPSANWVVWGVELADYEELHRDKPKFKNPHSYKTYQECSSKIKLWEGQDISVWFNENERLIDKSQCILEDDEERSTSDFSF